MSNFNSSSEQRTFLDQFNYTINNGLPRNEQFAGISRVAIKVLRQTEGDGYVGALIGGATPEMADDLQSVTADGPTAIELAKFITVGTAQEEDGANGYRPMFRRRGESGVISVVRSRPNELEPGKPDGKEVHPTVFPLTESYINERFNSPDEAGHTRGLDARKIIGVIRSSIERQETQSQAPEAAVEARAVEEVPAPKEVQVA